MILPKKLFIAGALISLCCLIESSGILAADTKVKKGKSNDATASARIRVWKAAIVPDRVLRVVIRSSAKKSAPVESELSESQQFLTYQNIPSGLASLEVFDGPTAKTSVATRSIYLPPDAFFTVLLREVEGAITTEVVDDTPMPQSTEVGEVTIRNLVSDLATLRVKIGDEVNLSLASPDSLVVLRGLPRQTFRVETSGATKAGTSINWMNEIDLKKFRKLTILVYPDSFGRIRPRVIIDGGVGDPPAE